VYPSEVERALRGLPGVGAAFVTEVSGAVGAAVITDRDVEDLRVAARKVLSAFKVPTLWWRVESDDAIPRKATGKVDVRALRELLAERGVRG